MTNPASDEFTKEADQGNIELISSKGKNTPLKQNSVGFFSRNSFHRIQEPKSYFSELLALLKNTEKVTVIDYRKTKKTNFIKLLDHCFYEQKIVYPMKKSSDQLLKSYNISEGRSYNIFKKNKLA